MTNFERLFQEQMNDPEFAKAYHESQLERIFCEFLENMKEQISSGASAESLVHSIDDIQNQLVSF